MNCRRCGTILPNGVVVCPNCGQDNKQVDINQGNLSVNDLMNINKQNNGPQLDFVNEDKNVGNSALNNYNNNNNFQYNKEIFSSPFMKEKKKFNYKPFIILGIIILFFGGLYLIFGDEFKKSETENKKSREDIVESGTHNVEPGDPDDPEDPDDPDTPADPGDPDPKYDPNDPSTDPYNHGGSSGSGLEEGRKEVIYKNVKYTIPSSYSSRILEESNFLYINNGFNYALFTLDLGHFDYFIGNTSTIVDRMNSLSDEDSEFTVKFQDSTRIGNYIFYLFDFGIENSKIFLVKCNDNYYYQGVVYSTSGSINDALKFIKDVFLTTDWIEDTIDEETIIPSEYSEHIIIRDIRNI